MSGSFTALLLELQLQHSCHENQSTRPGRSWGGGISDFFVTNTFQRLLPFPGSSSSSSHELRGIQLYHRKKLCMELAKYSTLPVSLSCFHSGTVCSCRLRPYSAIDAKELAGLVVASLFSVAALTNTSACLGLSFETVCVQASLRTGSFHGLCFHSTNLRDAKSVGNTFETPRSGVACVCVCMYW